jgi:hypothetical protein
MCWFPSTTTIHMSSNKCTIYKQDLECMHCAPLTTTDGTWNPFYRFQHIQYKPRLEGIGKDSSNKMECHWLLVRSQNISRQIKKGAKRDHLCPCLCCRIDNQNYNTNKNTDQLLNYEKIGDLILIHNRTEQYQLVKPWITEWMSTTHNPELWQETRIG